MILSRDDFLPDPEAVRRAAVAAPFIDWTAPDGETYKRICITEVPGLEEALAKEYPAIDILAMGYRLNYAGERPNAAIHSDIGWGTHALVVYLNQDGPGGTAFWQHRATGKDKLIPDDTDTYDKVKDDWNDVTKWKLRDVVPLAFNRAAIYPSTLFHSRWPMDAFGQTPDDGRLIAVAFFNVNDDSTR